MMSDEHGLFESRQVGMRLRRVLCGIAAGDGEMLRGSLVGAGSRRGALCDGRFGDGYARRAKTVLIDGEPFGLPRDALRRADIGDVAAPPRDQAFDLKRRARARIDLNEGIRQTQERMAVSDEREIVMRGKPWAPIAPARAPEDETGHDTTLDPTCRFHPLPFGNLQVV